MKSKNPARKDGLIAPVSKKTKQINTIKRVLRQSSDLVERDGEKILTEEGKELLNEN